MDTLKTRTPWTRIGAALGALALLLSLAGPAEAYHETLYVTVNGVRIGPDDIRALERMYGTRIPSGHYAYDPATGRLWPVGAVLGGEQLYRGQSRQDYGWRNPGTGSWGYSNPNTGTNVICDGGDCNFAR